MVTESGLKLRTYLNSAKTLVATTDGFTTHYAGDMVVVGDTLGVVMEDVGVNSDFVLVYEAEKIVVPKVPGPISPGQSVYYDLERAAVTWAVRNNEQDFNKCGISLESAGYHDTEILIDLMVMA